MIGGKNGTGEKGEGNVVIDLSDPTIAPDIQEHDGKIILSFARTQLPDKLRVRLDVKDFATPVQFVNAATTGDRAIITVEPSGRAFTSEAGGTRVQVDIDVVPEYEAFMSDTWPRALALLKTLCEARPSA